jgi:adenosylhomocysteine nucleosidase
VKTVVIVSADGEWKTLKALIPVSSAVAQKSPESFETKVGDEVVTFVHGGWGKVAAAASTQMVIDGMRPDLLLNLGTCGGFQGRIDRGAIMLVERTIIYDIVEQMTDSEGAIDSYSTDLNLNWLPERLPTPVQRGLLVSADRDIVAADIPELIRKYNAVAADWESGAIAWVARKNNQRLLILRGVTDLVSTHGGEAYGDYKLFLRRTSEIMKHLLEILPKWLDALESRMGGSAQERIPPIAHAHQS